MNRDLNTKTQKTICLAVMAAALCAGLYLGGRLLLPYSHTVPIVVGIYRKALFALLGLVFAAAAGFYFFPFRKQTAAGTACIAFCVLWFTGRMLLGFRDPGDPLKFWMDRMMPLPLLAFCTGAALWADFLFPEFGKKYVFSEKRQLLLILLLVFICLEPVLNGGFNWDDAFFSVEAQAMRVRGESVFNRVRQEITDYIQIGRINPFATFHFLVFYFIPDAGAYKLLLVFLTLLNGFLFFRFLKQWGRESRAAFTALLIVPLCFQLRLYHDPLNSYYGLMQVMFCELMLSLTCFVRWMQEGKKKDLVLSLVLFAMGLMSYEMFFPLTALFLLPALDHEKKLPAAIRRVLPFLLTAVVLFVLSMLLRTNITEETAYNGTTFSLDPREILRTLGLQLRAAFPLSYRTAGYDAALFGSIIPWHTTFNASFTGFLRSICWQDLLACVILILTVSGLPNKRMKFSAALAVFALLLWILPGVVISLSWKYQVDLYPGVAYIPVYFSCFGAAMLMMQCCALLERRLPYRVIRTLAAGIGCAVLLITMQDNRHISGMLNDFFLYPRMAGEAALQAGLLGDDAETSDLIISNAPPSLWEQGWQGEEDPSAFYTLNARKPLSVMSARDFASTRKLRDKNGWLFAKNTVITDYRGNKNGGFAKKGRMNVTWVNAEDGKLSLSQVTNVLFFVSGDNMTGKTLVYNTAENESVRIPVEEAWLLRETDRGRLYKLEEARPVIFESIGLLD